MSEVVLQIAVLAELPDYLDQLAERLSEGGGQGVQIGPAESAYLSAQLQRCALLLRRWNP
jgi:hypothetical protein